MESCVYSCDGRVEVMLFKEEFKQSVDKLNSAINAVVATAQRERSSTCLFVLVVFFCFFRSIVNNITNIVYNSYNEVTIIYIICATTIRQSFLWHRMLWSHWKS